MKMDNKKMGWCGVGWGFIWRSRDK